MVIVVLSSFIPGPDTGPGPTTYLTSVVVVLPAKDGARCSVTWWYHHWAGTMIGPEFQLHVLKLE
jgi:hypothetical protein